MQTVVNVWRLFGRNGCGKTTLLMQILAGVVRPDAGELIYFDRHPLKQPKLFRQYCGYIPQEMPLIEELTVKDNLRLWGADCSETYAQIIHYFFSGRYHAYESIQIVRRYEKTLKYCLCTGKMAACTSDG